MFPQVTDFLDESEALHALLAPLSDRDFSGRGGDLGHVDFAQDLAQFS